MLSDEIYSELTFEGVHTSIASLPGMKERTIFLHGFSKAFAMTGWRIGYACGPATLIVRNLAEQNPTPSAVAQIRQTCSHQRPRII